jgi:hypothetical protein
MRHAPCEYFIKYLCSRPGTAVANVKVYMASMGIAILPTPTYVDDIYQDLSAKFPTNYNPRDKGHKPSQLFLKRERIRDMWKGTQQVKEALAMFKNRPLREIVEAMILTGMPDEHISALLIKYKAINVYGSTVAVFRHYFWNTDLMSQEDWSEYLTQPSIQPVKLTALRAPKNMDGVRLTLYKMGIMPKHLDKKSVFASIRDIGYMNFLEANGFPQGFKKAQMIEGYASVVKGAQQQLDEYEAGEQDVIAQFYKNLTVTSRTKEHKSWEELTGEDDGDGEEAGSIRKLPSGNE